MRTLKEWRFIPFGNFSPYENMAIDEYMIKYYKKEKRPVFRLYGWNPSAISVGKNQDALNDIDLESCADNNICVVRRLTGGGAILHDDELTYSLVCSEDDIKNGDGGLTVKQSFEKLNSFILTMYKNMKIRAKYAKDFHKGKKFGQPAAFCFSGNEEYDIVIKGKKLGGNAQCRKKDIIFQHGSIPFDVSPEKAKKYFRQKINFENFTDFKSVSKNGFSPESLGKNLISALKETMNVKMKEQALCEAERQKVDKLVAEKYGNDEWNLKGEGNGLTD